MEFVLCSMNSDWVKRMKSVLLESESKYKIIKNPEMALTYETPAIYLIDVDTVQNKTAISKIKAKENVIALYLVSVNINRAGIDYPKYRIISSQITSITLAKIIVENAEIYADIIAQSKLEPPKPKEEAIKNLPEESMPIKKEELNESDDDFEDDFDIIPKKQKKEVSVKEAVYEEEEDFKPFEDREDLEVLAAKNIKEERKESIIQKQKEETESKEHKSEEESIKKADMAEVPITVKKILYENNKRADKNLGEAEYVANLDLEKDMRCPIVFGKPMEYIEITKSFKIDQALSNYRINKLKKAGLDKWQIVQKIKEQKNEEDSIRQRSLKEREMKRLEFLKKFDESSVSIDSTTKKKEDSSKEKSLLKEFGGLDINKGAISVDESQYVPKGMGDAPAPIPVAKRPPPLPTTPLKKKEDILLGKKEEAKARNLIMETETESLTELFKKKREEQRQAAEEALNSSKKSSLPELPTSKLTDRSPMANFYENQNVKRAQSKTSLKSVRPPKDMIPEVPDEDKKKKKGFFGFGKKK